MESKVSVGVLQVEMELIPSLAEALSEDVLLTQISLEKSRQAEKERMFLVYAKQWWKEYLQIRDSHRERLIKMFAQVNCTNYWYLNIHANKISKIIK